MFALILYVAPPRLQIEIGFTGPQLPPRVAAAAVAEVQRIWKPYGVDVRIAPAPASTRAADVLLNVSAAGCPQGALADGSLGSIEFAGDVPLPLVMLYPQTAAELLDDAAILLEERPWPGVARDTMLGRALGRALAHEIGHYLLRSRQHAPDGLMRARHSMADMMRVDHGRFTLSSSEMARLRPAIAALVQAASDRRATPVVQ